MHSTQQTLLVRLTKHNGQTYSELTDGYDFENNIVSHLKQLTKDGLVEKVEDIYKITAKGVREIYAQGLPDLDYPRKKLFFVGLVVTDEEDNYLTKGHPAARVNFYNLPSGDPRFGEKMEESLLRIFETNTGIKIEPERFEFISLHTKLTKTPEGEVLFDDGQAIFRVVVSKGEKDEMKLMEAVEWKSKKELKKLPNCWPEIKMTILDKEVVTFANYEVVTEYKL